MAFTVRKNTVLYVTEEVTQGTAVDPTLGSQAVAPLEDGFEFTPQKELVERNNLTSSIGQTLPRTGIKTSTGSMPVEWKAHGTAGTEPEYDLLLRSGLSGRRQIASQVTTKATGNTTQVLQIEDADISNFNVNDIILVREAGAFFVSPITAVDTTASAANITLLRTAGSAFSASVVIEKVTNYYGANSGHKYLTATAFYEDNVKEQAIGCLVNSVALENFSVGQIPSLNFSMEGIGYSRTVSGASGLTAEYDSALPPIALEACVYLDGTVIAVSDVAFSIENTIGQVTSTCDSNGILLTRVTERAVSGSLTPYFLSDDVSLYTKFDQNTEFSLFGYAKIDTGTTGEFKDVVAFYIPKAIITEDAKGDQDGIVTEPISFQAGVDSTGSDITLAFI